MENKKSKTGAIKLVFDIVMSVLFVIVYNAKATGMQFHEMMGIFIFALFLFHNLLNFSWIKSILTTSKKPENGLGCF